MSYSNLVQHAAHASYKAAKHNVSKTRQVVMLYDGAIRFIKQAIQSIQDNDIQERYNNLDRVSKIIMGLQSSLDFDKGGEISSILDHYYHGIDMRVIQAQRSNNIESLQQIMKEVKMMREAWDEVDKVSSSFPSYEHPTSHSTGKETEQASEQDKSIVNRDHNASGISLDI